MNVVPDNDVVTEGMRVVPDDSIANSGMQIISDTARMDLSDAVTDPNAFLAQEKHRLLQSHTYQ